LEAELWIGPAIVAAVIAGLINVAGWFVTFRHARRLERERRAEKVTDTQTAILAEIRSDLQNLKDINVADEIAAVAERLATSATGEPYTPFVPRSSGSPIFSAMVDDVAILPTPVIDPIVLYYKQRETISHFTEDLRADSFKALPADRKLLMMQDYLRLQAYAAQLAWEAVGALEGSLGLKPSINNKAAGQSDRKSASGSAASGQASSFSASSIYKPD
jgi:hypothetical protein